MSSPKLRNITKNKRKILALGACSLLAIGVPYIALTRTSFLHNHPIICKTFPTVEPGYGGEIEVCVNGVSEPYAPDNGDVELDIVFQQPNGRMVQADIYFWTAHELGGQEVDYEGEYNIDHVRIYHNGWKVLEDGTKVSGWIEPLVPADVRIPMWQWVKDHTYLWSFEQVHLVEKIEKGFESLGAIGAAMGSIGVTAFKFWRASSGME